MKAYIFPGQGAQFTGMGKDIYESSAAAKQIFDEANEVLGFDIKSIMFGGTEDELKQTNVTQPAIFIHSVALVKASGGNFKPDMTAGHSLGEFSALAASGVLSWQKALELVAIRANAMQKACELKPSTMAAILGLDDHIVEETCKDIDDVVVPANYNSPGQLVISGTVSGIEKACEALKAKGAKRAIVLNVGGAFHSPLMEPAREELAKAIKAAEFKAPICPIYQNVIARGVTNPEEIKLNLIAQLTAPVKWTQTVKNMYADGAKEFIEAGPGKVLQGLVKKIAPEAEVSSLVVG